MRREVLRFRERNEARLRHEDVNQQLWDDMREQEEERAKYEESVRRQSCSVVPLIQYLRLELDLMYLGCFLLGGNFTRVPRTYAA